MWPSFEHLWISANVSRRQDDRLAADVSLVCALLVLRHKRNDAPALILFEVLGAHVVIDAVPALEDDAAEHLAIEDRTATILEARVPLLLENDVRTGVFGDIGALVVRAEHRVHVVSADLEQPLERIAALVDEEPQQVLVDAASADAHPVARELPLVDVNARAILDARTDRRDVRTTSR